MDRWTCCCVLLAADTTYCGAGSKHSETPVISTRLKRSSTWRMHFDLTTPVCTMTWEHYNGSSSSTVDILLATRGLSEACEYCGIHRNDHCSDHKDNRSHFVVDTIDQKEKRREGMYDEANW